MDKDGVGPVGGSVSLATTGAGRVAFDFDSDRATRPAPTKSLIGKEIKGILAGSLQSSPAILAIAAWPNPSGPWAEPTDSRGRS